MGMHLKLVLLVLLLLVLVFLVNHVRDKKLVLQYTLSWMFLIAGLAVVILFPELLNVISNLIGIATPINTVFFLGFLFTLIIIYDLTKAVSRMSVEITRLCQEIAILKKKEEDQSSQS